MQRKTNKYKCWHNNVTRCNTTLTTLRLHEHHPLKDQKAQNLKIKSIPKKIEEGQNPQPT